MHREGANGQVRPGHADPRPRSASARVYSEPSTLAASIETGGLERAACVGGEGDGRSESTRCGRETRSRCHCPFGEFSTRFADLMPAGSCPPSSRSPRRARPRSPPGCQFRSIQHVAVRIRLPTASETENGSFATPLVGADVFAGAADAVDGGAGGVAPPPPPQPATARAASITALQRITGPSLVFLFRLAWRCSGM